MDWANKFPSHCKQVWVQFLPFGIGKPDSQASPATSTSKPHISDFTLLRADITFYLFYPLSENFKFHEGKDALFFFGISQCFCVLPST